MFRSWPMIFRSWVRHSRVECAAAILAVCARAISINTRRQLNDSYVQGSNLVCAREALNKVRVRL